jgi:cytochrome bd-type quinol oxidase subunit 2
MCVWTQRLHLHVALRVAVATTGATWRLLAHNKHGKPAPHITAKTLSVNLLLLLLLLLHCRHLSAGFSTSTWRRCPRTRMTIPVVMLLLLLLLLLLHNGYVCGCYTMIMYAAVAHAVQVPAHRHGVPAQGGL